MSDGLVAALARCQAKFPPIVKSHTNPAFKGSQYADVADVLAAVRPVLAAEGIVVSQATTVWHDGTVMLRTTLMLGEEREDSHFPLNVENLNPQQVGSLLTYHRRYQLCALLGVHPEGDDDDGNTAAAAAPARSEPRVVVESARLAEYRETVQARIAALDDSAKDTVAAWIRNHKVPSLKKPGATSEQLEELLAFIESLDSEPFGLDGPRPEPRPEPNEKPFEPAVNPVAEVRASLSGTERKGVNSAVRP